MTTRAKFLNNSLLSYLCASLLLGSFIAVKANAATLTVSDNLILRDVDDKAVEHGFLSKKRTIDLTQGKHTLVIKYKDVFEDLDMGEDRLVKSDYFVVKLVVENQQELFLSTSKISDLASAERFVQSPEVILLDENKQELVLELETLSDYKLGKQVTKVVTTLSAPVVISQSNSPTITTAVDSQAFNNKVINKVDTVPMLKYWWQKASKDEKEDFLKFINKK
ncbi:YccT family protein [Colwellia psychrerythraea]|uniref:DUF2057 domain-containing protein n=1 Tax=Colwellia psychrerythraea (strain 34H / ATCC BAA-681) TaxID=167879 RepID=Q480J2_COLP3|nr:DUF2057 domain-containing protein [Colwellia psychrerythraea]AAZ24983.1 hypothetical protein CPS_2815 [Colwellia psychrerythraea 34H]